MAAPTGATTATDLIVPEVYAPVIEAAIRAKVKFMPYVTVDDTLVGQPGETINYGQWNRIGDAETVAEYGDIPIEKLDTGTSSVTIAKVGKGAILSDESILRAMGNPQQQAASQIADACRFKMDSDVATTARTAAGKSITDPWSIDAALGALDLYDEPEDDMFAAWFISNAAFQNIRRDDRFTDASKSGQGSTLLRGTVGFIWNIPVVVTSKAKAGALLLEKDAMTLAMKRNIMLETERDTRNKSTLLTADVHYATFAQRPDGIVKFGADAEPEPEPEG
ncbi:N4-gp56 family major capsid protein [Cumulibacter soli]|uniref:N4-gp56 family major capsid protein n=1 Tax=Cumulibacter soli TaxID=2546344 RepID=UPI001067BA6B|nr:N4-gp56 family major capsid protein [Cumulibacter soli]